jgi:hypothetical protein
MLEMTFTFEIVESSLLSVGQFTVLARLMTIWKAIQEKAVGG